MPGHRAGHPDAPCTVFRDGRDKPGHDAQVAMDAGAIFTQLTGKKSPVVSSRSKSSPVATPK
jgi:hypothetical protein